MRLSTWATQLLRKIAAVASHWRRCANLSGPRIELTTSRSLGSLVRAGVGKLFTRRARFGKAVETAGNTLIGKQGKDLFFIFGDHSPRTNVISKRSFHLVFYFNFALLRLVYLKITAIRDLKKKKVFRSIHGGSLSFCKCRRA